VTAIDGFLPFRRVLVLCAHTDDEFGCAGTVARLVEQGSDVRYVALSRCEESVPVGFERDVLERECRACTSSLGLRDDSCVIHRFPVRHFPKFRQEILELLVEENRRFAPDLALIPSSFDTHQDHKTVFEEGFRALKHTSILGYELPQNLISFSNSAFVRLTSAHLERKITALDKYASQQFRPYAARDFITSLARVRGVQCSTEFAEAFEVVRLVLH
jgi:LmbE family N-acetylglucosaminyl deacetylase